ncbi:short-chain dehydrogenase [Flavobacterium sp. I3-2]|uniref:short-chain dehydrogenase n=1 Tax=Flavobacterium sp. I3-2 TaxID=2748319 RepID=UPI0015AA1E22|nr:short-chain dehydrogenase [Flavobacterium sp. I3-2]
MKFINKIIIIIFICLSISCSSDKTDEFLLEKDRIELEKSLDSYQVTTYKFGKILLRASIENDTISEDFQKFKSDLDRIFNIIINKEKNNENISLIEYISIYRDFKKMQNFILKTDEDVFPTLTDAIRIAYGDTLNQRKKFYEGDEKEYVQNMEHAVLSAVVILSKDLGKEISLYECSKTKPEFLPDSEIKTLLQFYRGFLFFEKGYLYLSEDEFSRNIEWLNKNKNVELPYTKAFFQWGNLNNTQTHIAFHSMNHLFRGIDRLRMERKIDEERALEDFEVFINDANEIGLNNEIVWSVETYLYLKKEDNEKTIAALTKLKSSELLTADEKKGIDESIAYIKNRNPEKVLNGFYDKFFIGKIATKYIFNVLSKIDWKKILKENNVPKTDEMFQLIDNFKEINNKITNYSNKETLKETSDEVKKAGENVLDKIGGLIK